MKMIVTGGAGFIGSNFVQYEVKNHPEDEIINLDLLTYAGNLESVKPVENAPNYRFVRGDIADREFIFRLFEEEKPDVIVNFAAESHVDRSITDPEIFVRTNVVGTTTLLDACRKYGIKRYHQVSTDEVYGDLPLDRPDLFCVLSIRIPQNRKEKSPFSDWEFPIIRKRHAGSSSWALPRPAPRRGGRKAACAAFARQGDPCRLCQGLPGRFASSVLSLDTAPAPG